MLVFTFIIALLALLIACYALRIAFKAYDKAKSADHAAGWHRPLD